jgi:hypothetical protein
METKVLYNAGLLQWLQGSCQALPELFDQAVCLYVTPGYPGES